MPSEIPKYSNEAEKATHFNIQKIETLVDLKSLIERLRGEDLIYRGVHDSTYKIFSSYHRYLHLHKGDKSYVEGEESIMTSKVIGDQIDRIVRSCSFRKNYMRIADDYAKANDNRYRLDTGHFRYCFNALSKMQHYDAKTFLVDFTHNPLIGLLFAVLDHHEAPYLSLISFPSDLITAVDLNDSSEDIEHYAPRKSVIKHIKNPGLLKMKLYDVGRQLLLHPLILIVEAEERYVRNSRQRAQKGCFVLYTPTDAHGIIIEGLESLITNGSLNPRNPTGEKFTSYEISSTLIPEIKKYLKEEGITPYKIGLTKYFFRCC